MTETIYIKAKDFIQQQSSKKKGKKKPQKVLNIQIICYTEQYVTTHPQEFVELLDRVRAAEADTAKSKKKPTKDTAPGADALDDDAGENEDDTDDVDIEQEQEPGSICVIFLHSSMYIFL